MAADKGKQFEYAIMIEALSRLPKEKMEKMPAVKAAYAKLLIISPASARSPDVKIAAKNMINKIQPVTGRNDFYKSFKQLGGGAGGGGEPKTDVLFVLNGKKYKCSLKWGDKYQLSSGGISNTADVLRKVLAISVKGVSEDTRKEITGFIVKFEKTLGILPKRGEQAVMKAAMKKNTHLKEKLEQYLGTRKVPAVDEAYISFKKAVIKESLTGELMFAGGEKSANYILNEKELKPINAELIKAVCDITYVRLRLKGRGQTDQGVRLNELVVTIEPK